MRGGVSTPLCVSEHFSKSSPRAWGCFFRANFYNENIAVFPTCVGVFLQKGFSRISGKSLPHVRGGVSVQYTKRLPAKRSSPRAWGCFYPSGEYDTSEYVFPTCVGVFPYWNHATFFRPSLPHVRGGVSAIFRVRGRSLQSSPRAWGCF